MEKKESMQVLWQGVATITLFAFAVGLVALGITEAFGVTVRVWWWTAFVCAFAICAALSGAIATRHIHLINTADQERRTFLYASWLGMFFLGAGATLLGMVLSFNRLPLTLSSASFYSLAGGVIGLGCGICGILALAEDEKDGPMISELPEDDYEKVTYS